QQFQPDEQPGQVLGTDQYQTASGGQQHQQVQLLAVARVALAGFSAQIGMDQGDAGQAGGQYQSHVVAGEVVDQQQRGDLQRDHLQGWNERQQRQVQTDYRKHEGQAVIA